MMAFIFLLFLILQVQVILGKSRWIKTQFWVFLVIALLWFNHHATDPLGLSW